MHTYIRALEYYFGDYNRVKTVSVPSDEIVDTGIVESVLYNIIANNDREIRQALNDAGTSWYSYNFGYMIHDAIQNTDSRWITERGRYTKRLMRNLPAWLQDYAGTIGESIQRRAISLNPTNYLVSITNTIFWSDGNFGKKYSCWWGSYEESQDVFLNYANGIGLLFHDDPNDAHNGIGRLWIAPLHERGEDCLFLFNQYGDYNNKPIRIEDSARILNTIIPETKAMNANLHNDVNGDIPYINGNSGIMIVEKTSSFVEYHDIHVNWGEPESEHWTCNRCGDRIDDEDELRTYEDNYYCASCFDRYFTICYQCGETVRNRDASTSQTDGETYCDSCYSVLFCECSECGQEIDRDNVMLYDWTEYCEDCFNERYARCYNCDDYFPIDEMQELDDNQYCNDCAVIFVEQNEPQTVETQTVETQTVEDLPEWLRDLVD